MNKTHWSTIHKAVLNKRSRSSRNFKKAMLVVATSKEASAALEKIKVELFKVLALHVGNSIVINVIGRREFTFYVERWDTCDRIVLCRGML